MLIYWPLIGIITEQQSPRRKTFLINILMENHQGTESTENSMKNRTGMNAEVADKSFIWGADYLSEYLFPGDVFALIIKDPANIFEFRAEI